MVFISANDFQSMPSAGFKGPNYSFVSVGAVALKMGSNSAALKLFLSGSCRENRREFMHMGSIG
mgnify:FL=1